MGLVAVKAPRRKLPYPLRNEVLYELPSVYPYAFAFTTLRRRGKGGLTCFTATPNGPGNMPARASDGEITKRQSFSKVNDSVSMLPVCIGSGRALHGRLIARGAVWFRTINRRDIHSGPLQIR